MAQADWTLATDSLSGSAVRVVESAAFTPPNGGGSFTQAMNSITTTLGAYAYFHNGVGFAPTTAGAKISGCMKKGVSGGPQGWTPFLAVCWQGPSVNDYAYLLGLGNGSPSRITLVKGPPLAGLPDVEPVVPPAPPPQGVLLRSTDVVEVDTWVHLKLEVATNLNGDAVINCYRNDLDVNPAGFPVWEPIPGMAQFIDDGAGIQTGTPAFALGRVGYGCWFSDVTRRAYFDYLQLIAQA